MWALALVLIAHTGDVKRSLAVEVAGDDVHVLAHLEITGEQRRSTFFVLADQNKDGRLSEPERKALETRLAVRALEGVRLLAGTSTLSLDNVEAALKTERDRPVSLMVHGRAILPPGTARLTVVTGEGKGPLRLMVRPGTRQVVRASRGRPQGGALTVQMAEIDRISWWLAPP